MIVDLLVTALSAVFSPVLALLPTGHLSLPDPAGLASALNGLDALVPVLGVLRIGAAMLALLVVFFTVRAVIFMRYLLLP